MKWQKTGTNKKGKGEYSASCDGEKTTFNLGGMIVVQDFTSQEDAVKFLIANSYMPFDIDGSSKSSEEVEISEEEPKEKVAKSVYELKEEVINQLEEDEDLEDEDEDEWEYDLEDDS